MQCNSRTVSVHFENGVGFSVESCALPAVQVIIGGGPVTMFGGSASEFCGMCGENFQVVKDSQG